MKATYIARVNFSPPSTRETPYQFALKSDAFELARIYDRVIWATIGGNLDLYEIYPGGREFLWREGRATPN
jgi:hypothetical protein